MFRLVEPFSVPDALTPEAVAGLNRVLDKHLIDAPDGVAQGRWTLHLGTIDTAEGKPVSSQVAGVLAGSKGMDWFFSKISADAYFLIDFCTFRYLDPTRRRGGAGWHFEANLIGPGFPMYNIWFALVDVGKDATGMMIAKAPEKPAGLWRRITELAAAEGGYFKQHPAPGTLFSDAEFTESYQADRVSVVMPELPVGAGLVFDERFLHCSAPPKPTSAPRRSLEVRVLPSLTVGGKDVSADFHIVHCTRKDGRVAVRRLFD